MKNLNGKIRPLLTILLVLTLAPNLIAQLPEKAEDISPLLIGETIPDMELVNTEGQHVSFHSLLQEKQTVLLFYRGGWCPYCNGHLAEIGQREDEMIALGFQVIAVSPDAVAGLEETGMKNEIKYQLLSDASGAFAEAAGIAYKAPERYEKRLFDVSDGQNKGFLPVPSVFVLDEKGGIRFEYINPNYKKRLSGDLLIAVLTTLKNEK